MINFHAFSKGWLERRLSPKTNVQVSKEGLKPSKVKPVVKKRGPNNVTQDYSFARTN